MSRKRSREAPAAEGKSAFLARAPLVLVVTILAMIPIVYFLAQWRIFQGVVPRWQIPEDLPQFRTYCLVVIAVLALVVRLAAPRYVVVFLGIAWTIILFGPGAVATVGAVGVTAYLLGASLLYRSAADSRPPWPVPLAFALGYAVLLGVFQAAVVIGLYNRFVVVLAASIVCWLSRARMVADSARLKAWLVEPMSGGWWSIAPLLIISIQLVYASFAETHSDALAIHLMIPHQISMIGTWNFDAATYTFAVMPKGANWLFTAHYLLAGEPAARLFNATVTFITGWLVFDVVRRQVGSEAGAWLAAMFLAAPLTFWVVFVMFEGALVTLFITAAVVMLMLTWRAPGQKEMALVALAVSAAIATKLQGLLLSIPIVVLVAVNLFRAGSLRGVRDACLRM